MVGGDDDGGDVVAVLVALTAPAPTLLAVAATCVSIDLVGDVIGDDVNDMECLLPKCCCTAAAAAAAAAATCCCCCW